MHVGAQAAAARFRELGSVVVGHGRVVARTVAVRRWEEEGSAVVDAREEIGAVVGRIDHLVEARSTVVDRVADLVDLSHVRHLFGGIEVGHSEDIVVERRRTVSRFLRRRFFMSAHDCHSSKPCDSRG